MPEKIIKLEQYRKAKTGYQKLVDNHPDTRLTFEDYLKVNTFLEKVHQAKLRKKKERLGE